MDIFVCNFLNLDMKKLFSFLCIVILFSCEEPEIFILTATVNPTEGGTVSPTNGQYESGDVTTVTATPNAEYVFEKWTGGATGTSNSVSVTMNGNKSVVANFIKIQYPLTIEIEGEGTVTETLIKQGLATEYSSGTIIELTAEPSGDWEFVEWTGDITSTENPVKITIDGPKTVKAKFKKTLILFQNNYPNYPEINLKSGTILNNLYSHHKAVLSEVIHSKIDIEDGDRRLILKDNSYRLFDYNNDKKPDLFGHLVKAGPNAFSENGKYFLVDDVFNSFDIKYFDSNRRFDALTELGDFDNDGQIEILVFSAEDHDNNNGQPVAEKIPLSIIDISTDGNISIRDVGPATSNHDLITIDFDNDGDIDIINYEWWMHEVSEHHEIPLVYINDGQGNFEIKDDLFTLYDSYYNHWTGLGDFVRTATDAFDLDNDGYLDLITGFAHPATTWEYRDGAEIVWGNSINFDYNDRSSKLEIDLDGLNTKEYLGFNFIDFNNDSYFDIISIGDSDGYNGGFIEIYKNNGDRTFTNVTKNLFDTYKWNSRRNGGIIPIIYEVDVIDVDKDGDFDLKPNYFRRGSDGRDDKKAIGENFYWENKGGAFYLKEDYYDID